MSEAVLSFFMGNPVSNAHMKFKGGIKVDNDTTQTPGTVRDLGETISAFLLGLQLQKRGVVGGQMGRGGSHCASALCCERYTDHGVELPHIVRKKYSTPFQEGAPSWKGVEYYYFFPRGR